MGDISTWNPVDNSNTAAPPDGWPEGMAPSGVNNSARAMMGAVRRWYDTVTTQISGMLPLTGGFLSGPLTAPFFHSTGSIVADDFIGCVDLGATGTIQGAQLTSTGNINAAVDIAATGVMTAAFIHSTGNVAADNVVSAPTMTATGTIQGAQLTSTGNINAAGTVTGTSFIGTVSVPANGPISTGGLITGGQIHSTGNMYVDGPLSVAAPCLNLDGAWQIISDARMKTGIADYKPGLEAILALRPCAYRYLPELFGPEEAEKTRYGLVADEVAPVLPEMVGETVFGGRHLSTLNPGHVSLLLVNACRELAAQNAALAARITALEGNHHAI